MPVSSSAASIFVMPGTVRGARAGSQVGGSTLDCWRMSPERPVVLRANRDVASLGAGRVLLVDPS